jgi:hypothetical protein
MQLSDHQQRLLDAAESHVRAFIQKRGGFTMFALAQRSDGEIQVVQSSGEFSKLAEELGAMFQVLLPLARDKVIDGSVLCSPFNQQDAHFAILDVETRVDGRCVVMVPFKKKLIGGWSFGERQYNRDTPRVFAS